MQAPLALSGLNSVDSSGVRSERVKIRPVTLLELGKLKFSLGA